MTVSALFLTAGFTLFGLVISLGASAYLDIEASLANTVRPHRSNR